MRIAVAIAVLLSASVVTVVLLVRHNSQSTQANTPPAPRSTLAPGVLPRPGVHVYAQTGYEEAKASFITIKRRFPKRAVLVVSGRGNVVQEEWRFSNQHLEATRTRVTPRGQLSIWQRTRLVMVITDDEAHPTVPVTLSRPNVLKVGQHWIQDYRVGGVRSVSRNRVTKPCVYRGQACFVVVADSKITGEHPGTERDVTWESTSTGLTLYETIDRKIGGTFPYEMHVELRLLR